MLEYLKQKLTTPFSASPPEKEDAGVDNGSFDCHAAAVNLARRTFRTFYSLQHKQFCSPYDEPGTIDARHGYTCWPVSIGLWSVANTAKRTKLHQDARLLDLAFEGMEKHWNPQERGYCAWVMFPGNRDLFFDDNAHCGNALVTAWEATSDRRYLNRARDIVLGILQKGWDRDGDGPGAGGVAWHIDHPNSRNACSTLSAAMLAARLALIGVERDYCAEMARQCIDFADRHLLAADDGLVLDSWHQDPDGVWRHDSRKFTYNTGFAIQAYLLAFELTGDRRQLDKATAMALTAVDPNSVLFDDVLAPADRMWWDCLFFAHHLVEALALTAAVLGKESEPGSRIAGFVARIAAWCMHWVRDPADGLYFRQLRPYWIDERRTRMFNERFGKDVVLQPDEGDHANGGGPIGERPFIKTLIANAAVANIYFYAADLRREVRRFE